MQFFKDIIARICATWGLLTFIITFLIVFPAGMIAYLMPEPRSGNYFIKISRFWMSLWFFLAGCPIRIKGVEHFKKGRSYVVVCNHNSLLDVTLSSGFIPGANKTIAKNSFAKIPIFGWYYAKGSILIDRESELSRKRSFEKMKKVLQLGIHMCIYPEGTRNKTSAPLKSFYNGAFKLAYNTQTDIIPGIILNTKKAVPLHRFFYFIPQKLEIHFLKPVITKGKTAAILKQEVYDIMLQYIIQNQRPL